MLRRTSCLCLVSLAALACGDDPTDASGSGSIRLVVATTGDVVDPDGYGVSLDGGAPAAVDVDDTVTFTGLSVGAHTLEISGMAPNCSVSESPMDVVVIADATSDARFDVACSSPLFGQIVFTADAGIGVGNDLFRMNPDGSGVVHIPSTPGPDAFAAVRRDGSRIVFNTLLDGNEDVYTMAPDGSALRRLTDDPGRDREPTWSPDGTRIAFVSERDGNQEIYTMAADGSDPRRLTDDPSVDSNPVWSPDGTRIAFSSLRGGDAEIYTMAADGTDVVALTDDPAADVQPAWSWNGDRIAFVSDRNGTFDLFTMKADGTDLQPLVVDASFDRSPVWSPDGSTIVFLSDRDGNFELYRVPVGGGTAVRLTDRPEFNQVWAQGWAPDPP